MKVAPGWVARDRLERSTVITFPSTFRILKKSEVTWRRVTSGTRARSVPDGNITGLSQVKVVSVALTTLPVTKLLSGRMRCP